MRGLTGKTALVTGGTGLIGSAIVRRFVEEEARVVVTSRNREKVESWIAAEGPAAATKLVPAMLALEDEMSIRRMFDELAENGALPSILIANASLRDGLATNPDQLTTEYFLKLFEVDIAGHFLCAREMLARLSEQEASIVFLSSIYATNGVDKKIYPEGMLGTPIHYSTVKAAALGMTRHLAAAYGHHGVRVNAVVAGGVRSPERQPNPEFLENYNRKTMLGRMAQADEIAGAVVFLASSDASYITGECLVVDGGFSAW
ncbi:MAG: SDR family oxidoreductase [Anaerolineae bacterium]|nr:SDR family oxidoreductase [Anaerolineae bacterium]NUQ06269.1 SDR family oxidoreductase [Anaerolineae bacterium]